MLTIGWNRNDGGVRDGAFSISNRPSRQGARRLPDVSEKQAALANAVRSLYLWDLAFTDGKLPEYDLNLRPSG